MIGAAILVKEVRLTGRRRLGYWARAIYLLLLLGLVSLAFVGTWQSSRYSQGIAQLQMLQQIAPALTATVLWFQFVVLCLAGPLMAGGAIVDERRARTLATLATTPLSSLSIVVGKLSSRLVNLVIACLLSAPLLLALRIFGGVNAEVIVAGTVLTISTGIMAASLALLASVHARNTPAAVLFGILFAGVLHLAPITTAGIIAASLGWNAPPAWAFATCAPAALMALSEPNLGASLGANLTTLWASNVGYNAAITAAAVVISASTLRRVMLAEDRLAIPTRGRPRRSRTLGDAPVLWREVRQRALPRRRWTWVLAIVFGGFLITVYAFGGLEHGAAGYPIGVLGTILILASAAVRPAAAIAGERDARTWDVLLTTRLSAREILWGKFIGNARRLWPVPALVSIHFVISTLAGQTHPVLLPMLAAAWIPPMVFLAGTGVLFSLVIKRTILATIANLSLALSIWAAVWGVFLVFMVFFDRAGWNLDGPFNLLVSVNPVATTVLAIAGTSRGWRGDYDLDFEVWNGLGPEGYLALLLVVGAGYIAAGLGAITLATQVFSRSSGRIEA